MPYQREERDQQEILIGQMNGKQTRERLGRR